MATSSVLAIFVAVNPFAQVAVAQQGTVFPNAVVAADHRAASEAGAEMLRIGGNVVDAAVATSFALSVVRPASCGIGGGGFMVIWNAKTKKAVALDYRETAPARADRNMFADLGPTEQSEAGSVRGGKANGVPGTVAGLCFAAQEYGTLPLKTLLAPAIRLARNGVRIDGHDQRSQSSALGKFENYPDYSEKYGLLLKLYLNDGVPWKIGDTFYSPQLPTLEKIAAEGRRGFYEGDVAKAIVRASQATGGIISLEDLKNAQPIVRHPLQDDYRGHKLLTMPPASSGGVALIQTIQTLEFWENRSGRSLKKLGHNSPDYVHVVTEAMKHAFADRAEFLGDSDFADVPVDRLVSRNYAQQIAAKIDMERTQPSKAYGRFFASDDAGTSHFSIIDKQGNAVACTETINLIYGSFVVVPKWGILLNDEVDDFAARPGEPNAFGLIQSEANAIAPGKKPLSSMTPTIVLKDGMAVFASGASGGPRIISATIQATLNAMVFGMDPKTAVSKPRFHHQWFPNELRLESELHDAVSAELQRRGHKTVKSGNLAANQSAAAAKTGLRGGSDPRKHGMPAGY